MTADTLETGQYFIGVTQTFFCSMYAVVIWDWLVSLPREWRYIWKTRTTPMKLAYIFCRYWVIGVVPYLLFCFVLSHPQSYCERIFPIPVALAMWTQFASSLILLLRSYAFYNQNKRVLVFLVVLMAVMVAYQLYVALREMQLLMVPFLLTANDQGIEPTGPCLPASKPHSAHLLWFFLAPLIFDTVVTGMTVIKAFHIRRQNAGVSNQILQTFLREGVFYYLLISVANLINGVFYLQPRQAISAINIPLSVMLGPILACRLILDLRQRGSKAQVPHSEGSTVAGFTTNANVNTRGTDSPFSTHMRKKNRETSVFSTVGSEKQEEDEEGALNNDMDLEQGMDIGVSLDYGGRRFVGASLDKEEPRLSGPRIMIEVEKTSVSTRM